MSWLEWTQTFLLLVDVTVTTLCLGGYRPDTMAVTIALTTALLVVHLVACAKERRPLRTVESAGRWLLPFLAYAAVNVGWVSPVRWLGWLDWLGWANLIAVFWVALNGIRSSRTRWALFLTLVLLGLVAVVLGGYQCFVRPGWLMLGRQQAEQFVGRASGPFGIPNSLAGFLLLLIPTVATMTFRRGGSATARIWWGWVTAVFLFGLLLTVSRGAWIGLALATVIWPLTVTEWRWPRRLIVATAVCGGVIGVGAMIYALSPKTRERFEHLARDAGELSRPVLWRGAWQLFREHPAVGTGAGSYNVLFEKSRPTGFLDEPRWAHNDYLNTLSDYGVIGFGLMFGACVLIACRTRRGRSEDRDSRRKYDWLERPAVARALGIGVAAFAFQLFVEFHLRIPALAMAVAIVAALAVRRRSGSSTVIQPGTEAWDGPRFVWFALAVLVAGAAVPALRFQKAEAARYRGRETLDVYAANPAGDLMALAVDAESRLRHAVALASGNAAAWSDLAFALELQAIAVPNRGSELAPAAEAAARRAVAVSEVVPEFWIRLGVALDMQRRSAEARRAFEKSLELAPRKAEGWYYYAYHLSLDTKARDAALRAIANCLSLDPGNRAAEALRVKLNARPTDALIVP